MSQLAKPDEVLGDVERFDREVQLQTILRVLDFRVKTGGCSMRQACKELDVPYYKFLRWIKAGVLTDYLESLRDPEVEMLKLRALQAMPGVLENMIALANGNRTMRGVNPVAAAKFVVSVAGDIYAGDSEDDKPSVVIQQNFFQPQTYKIPYQETAPVLEQQVIDAEATEVEELPAPKDQ